MSVWSSFEFERWLEAGEPVENYMDDDKIINPGTDVIHLYLDATSTVIHLSSVSKFKNLEYLKLCQYVGTELPQTVSTLRNLVFLSINSQPDTSLTSFPEEVCQLEKLQDLKISGQRFTSVSNHITLLQDLHTLDLSRNLINEVPNMSCLTRLQSINLSGNPSVNIDNVLRIDSLRTIDLTGVSTIVYDGTDTRLPGALTTFIYGDSMPDRLKDLWVERNRQVNFPAFRSMVQKKLHEEALKIMEEGRETNDQPGGTTSTGTR